MWCLSYSEVPSKAEPVQWKSPAATHWNKITPFQTTSNTGERWGKLRKCSICVCFKRDKQTSFLNPTITRRLLLPCPVQCSWVASFHSAVGFVALTALDCQVSQLSPPAVSVFSDVLYRWGLSMCAICSLPLSSLEESSEVGQDMCFNQSVFPRDFRFLPFQSLSRGGGGESLWGCLVLPSVNSGPCCETEPFELPLERLSLVWGFFPPSLSKVGCTLQTALIHWKSKNVAIQTVFFIS